MTEDAVQGIPTPAPIDPQRIAETLKVARWREAEDRVYPLVMVDPALYQDAVSVVAKVCELLRGRDLSRAELLALNTDEVAASVLVDPELHGQITALHGSAGLSAATLVEAALAQLASLTPPGVTR